MKNGLVHQACCRVKRLRATAPTLLRLLEAVVNRRRYKVEYGSPDGTRPRRFHSHPYRLVAMHGGLYCVGRVPAYKNFTTLALELIRSLELLDESFTVDPVRSEARYPRPRADA